MRDFAASLKRLALIGVLFFVLIVEFLNTAIEKLSDHVTPEHHKAIGRQMWGKSVVTLHMVDSARKAGTDVMIDQYPYTASSTSCRRKDVGEKPATWIGMQTARIISEARP